jgi:hypothetical protein
VRARARARRARSRRQPSGTARSPRRRARRRARRGAPAGSLRRAVSTGPEFEKEGGRTVGDERDRAAAATRAGELRAERVRRRGGHGADLLEHGVRDAERDEVLVVLVHERRERAQELLAAELRVRERAARLVRDRLDRHEQAADELRFLQAA